MSIRILHVQHRLEELEHVIQLRNVLTMMALLLEVVHMDLEFAAQVGLKTVSKYVAFWIFD